MQLAPAEADFDLTRFTVKRNNTPRGLLIELIAYLQQRQGATSYLVDERMQRARTRIATREDRHALALQRMTRLERRLARLDEQVADLRLITETLKAPRADKAAPAESEERDESIPHGPTLLRVEGLAKEIGGTDILRDITFEIYEGEILGLIGPNGAGKTTLMECLAGMRPRTGGTFFIGEEAPASWEPKGLLFYLPNNVQPFAELYTYEVLRLYGDLYEVEPQRWQQIVRRDLSLGPVLGKRVAALSKGNMQRLMIALALMSPQPLLALDEPFDGLDLHQTQAMMGILRRLRAQSRTLMLCIHQLNDAERICDRFLLLSSGRLVAVGTLAELRAQTGLQEGTLEQIFMAVT